MGEIRDELWGEVWGKTDALIHVLRTKGSIKFIKKVRF
jgi:hypothetical protein